MTIIKFRKCTQAQYDALQPPRNPAILYFISDCGWFYLGDTKYYSGTSETGLYLKLDANGKINLAYLYDSILGQMEYAGTFDPTAGYPSITNAFSPNDRAPRKGDYFIATGTGTIEGTEFNNKDWLIKTTDGWQHIDNTDAVASVNGKMGVVVLDGTDIQLGGGVTTTIQAEFIAVDTLLDDKVDKNANITAGTHPKITYDAKGLVTGGEALVATDIPNLDTSKLTTGTLGIARGGTGRTDGYAVGVVETRASVLTKIWTGTQAQYDDIGTKDANTLYFIM